MKTHLIVTAGSQLPDKVEKEKRAKAAAASINSQGFICSIIHIKSRIYNCRHTVFIYLFI